MSSKSRKAKSSAVKAQTKSSAKKPVAKASVRETPATPAFDAKLPWPVLVAFVALAALQRYFVGGPILGWDDAFITYRFALNNASGHFFHWNVTEPPVYGTTTFLYSMLLTIPALISSSLVPAASILILLLCQIGAAIFSYLLVGRWTGHKVLAILAGALVASDGFSVAGTLGMETYLYIFLVLGTLWFYQQDKLDLTAVFAACLVMTRIDGALLSALLAVHYLITQRRVPVRPLLIYLATLLPWIIVTVGLFNSFLPSSFHAKQAHRAIGTSGVYSVARFDDYLGLVPFVILSATALLGLISQVRWWRRHSAVVLGLFVILNPLLYQRSMLPDFVWYYAPPIAGAWVLAAAGIGLVARWMVARWAGVAVLAVASLWVSYNQFQKVGTDLQYRDWGNSVYVEAAQYLRQNAKPGQSVAAAEVGIIGFYNPELVVHDLMGLVSPDLIQPLQRLQFVESVERLSPDYIFLADAVGYKITEGIFHPDLFYQRFGRALRLNMEWLKRYQHFYPDNYVEAKKWFIRTARDGSGVFYVLAQKKAG